LEHNRPEGAKVNSQGREPLEAIAPTNIQPQRGINIVDRSAIQTKSMVLVNSAQIAERSATIETII
jgi:hypothetical protein